MNRCPRCNAELPANAHFCNKCGFNAKTMSTSPPQGPGKPAAPQTPTAGRPAPAAPYQMAPPLVQAKPPISGGGTHPVAPAQQATMGQPPMQTQQRGPAVPASAPGNTANIASPPSLPMGIEAVRTSTPPRQNPNAPFAGQPIPTPPGPPRPAGMPSMPNTPQQQPMQQQQRPTMPAAPPNVAPPNSRMGIAPPHTPPGAMYPGGTIPNLAGGAGPESLAATSRAAEHWRRSWVARQRAEAGPALGIARGQASVAEPLMKMQNSFLRIRATSQNNAQQQQRQSMSFGFWVTIAMMAVLIVGLVSYVIYTYLPGAPLQTQIATTSAPDPTLTLDNAKTTTFTAGQELQVHGNYFGANDTIIFILNTTQLGTSVLSSSQGSFTVALRIPATTLAGAYALQAQDNHLGKHAFLDIQVLPVNRTNTTTAATIVSAAGNPLASLKFTATLGGANPAAQDILLQNQDANAIAWTATPITDDGLNWLVITNNQVNGTINAGGNANLGITVATTGLTKNGTYTGIVAFTIAGQGQLLLPVSLQLGAGNAELVVNPNPVVVIYQAGGTCAPTTLTLIDLSNFPVIWTVTGDAPSDTQHIHINGATSATGTLDPAGPTGTTVVLNLMCVNVNLNDTYHVTVYYDSLTQHVPIEIGS